MAEDTLFVRKEKSADRVKFKVKQKKHNLYSEPEYKNEINIRDAKQLAMVLDDMKTLFDAPIDKAFMELKKNKSPFW
jgi:hypothetical protein